MDNRDKWHLQDFQKNSDFQILFASDTYLGAAYPTVKGLQDTPKELCEHKGYDRGEDGRQDRPERFLMSYALRATDRGDPSTMLSNSEITVSFEMLMAAGSEVTAATPLSGVTPTNS